MTCSNMVCDNIYLVPEYGNVEAAEYHISWLYGGEVGDQIFDLARE